MLQPGGIRSDEDVTLRIKGDARSGVEAARSQEQALLALITRSNQLQAALAGTNAAYNVAEKGARTYLNLTAQIASASKAAAVGGVAVIAGAIIAANSALTAFDSIADAAIKRYNQINQVTAVSAIRIRDLAIVVREVSQELRVSAETYQLLAKGVGADRTIETLRTFRQKLDAARTGDAATADIFRGLGIDPRSAKSTEKLVTAIADALERVENRAVRSRVQMQLFGPGADAFVGRVRDIAKGNISLADSMDVISAKQVAVSNVLQQAAVKQQALVDAYQRQKDLIKAEVFATGEWDPFAWVDSAKLKLLSEFHGVFVTLGMFIKNTMLGVWAAATAASMAFAVALFQQRAAIMELIRSGALGSLAGLIKFFAQFGQAIAAGNVAQALGVITTGVGALIGSLRILWGLLGPGKWVLLLGTFVAIAGFIQNITANTRAWNTATAEAEKRAANLRKEQEALRTAGILRSPSRPHSLTGDGKFAAEDATNIDILGVTHDEALQFAQTSRRRESSIRQDDYERIQRESGLEARIRAQLNDVRRRQQEILEFSVSVGRQETQLNQAAAEINRRSKYDPKRQKAVAAFEELQKKRIPLDAPFITAAGDPLYGLSRDTAVELEGLRQSSETKTLSSRSVALYARSQDGQLGEERRALEGQLAQIEEQKAEQRARNARQRKTQHALEELRMEKAHAGERFRQRELTERQFLAMLDTLAEKEIEIRKKVLKEELRIERERGGDVTALREQKEQLKQQLIAQRAAADARDAEADQREQDAERRRVASTTRAAGEHRLDLRSEDDRRAFEAGAISQVEMVKRETAIARERLTLRQQELDVERELASNDPARIKAIEDENAAIQRQMQLVDEQGKSSQMAVARQESDAISRLRIEATARTTRQQLQLEEIAARDRRDRFELSELELAAILEQIRQRSHEAELQRIDALLKRHARNAEQVASLEDARRAAVEQDVVARAQAASTQAQLVRRQADIERQAMYEIANLQAQAYGDQRRAQILSIAQSHESMVRRLRESGLEEYVDTVSAAYRRMVEEVSAHTLDLTQTVRDGVTSSLVAIAEQTGSLKDIWKGVRQHMVGQFANAFTEVLVAKSGFDLKFKMNMTQDLPGWSRQGAEQVGNTWGGLFNLLSGGTGVSPGVSIGPSGTASFIGGSAAGASVGTSFGPPVAVGAGMSVPDAAGGMMSMPDGSTAFVPAATAGAPAAGGGLLSLFAGALPGLAGLTFASGLGPSANPAHRILGAAAGLSMVPGALASLSAGTGLAASYASGAAATGLTSASSTLGGLSGTLSPLSAMMLPAVGGMGMMMLGNAVGLEREEAMGAGVGTFAGGMAGMGLAATTGIGSTVMAGAALGSFAPGIGTVIGMAIGAIVGALLGDLTEHKKTNETYSRKLFDATFDELGDVFTMGGQLDEKTMRAEYSKLYPANRRYETITTYRDGRPFQRELPWESGDFTNAPRKYSEYQGLVRGIGLLQLARGAARKGGPRGAIGIYNVDKAEVEVLRRLSPGAGERVMRGQFEEMVGQLAPSFDAALATINETVFGRGNIVGKGPGGVDMDILKVYAEGVAALAEATLDLPKAAVAAIRAMGEQGMLEVDKVMDYAESVMAATETATRGLQAAFAEMLDAGAREQALYEQTSGRYRLEMLQKQLLQAKELRDEVEAARLGMEITATEAALKASEVLDPGKAFLKAVRDGMQQAVTESLISGIMNAGVVQVAMAPVFEQISKAGDVWKDPNATAEQKAAAMAKIQAALSSSGPGLQQAAGFTTELVALLEKSGLPYLSFDSTGLEKFPLTRLGATDATVQAVLATGGTSGPSQMNITIQLDNAVIADQTSLDVLVERVGQGLVEIVKQQQLVSL